MASTSRVRTCDLPNEVLVSIFSFLPVADLAHCAATCKRWHSVVRDFTSLWKGKVYDTTMSPAECAETRAVLRALPLFPEIIINSFIGFSLRVCYPRMIATVKYIRILEDHSRLRCECLSTRMDIAGDILYHQSTIDFDRIRHLRILPKWLFNSWAPHYTADYVVRASLSVCPSLRNLSVCEDFLSADYLDEIEGFSQLQALEIACPGLEKLSFLRHCSGELEELQLVGCTGLPSRELAKLPLLQNLRKLQMSDCQFEEGDLAAAVAGLGNLESLQLNCCSSIRDLSVLQHCGRLRELCITKVPLLNPMMMLQPGNLRLHETRLPTAYRLRHVSGVTLTVGSLSAALSRMEELELSSSLIAYLAALSNCSQLRHVCCEIAFELYARERVHITLTSSI